MSISTTKRLLAALIAIVFTVATAKAQAPQKMSFQSVVRNSSGVLVASHSVGLRLSILQGSISGTAVYVETQTATSNANGLVTLQIGGGTVVSGTFSSIDWSAGPYYIKSEIDPTGGTTYGIAGTTQLLSVAYALYSNSAGSVSSGSSSNISENMKIIDTAGTYTWIVPSGVYVVIVEAVSAGGGGGSGGGGYYVYTPGGGGGASGQYQKMMIKVTPGMVINIIVGAGGIGGSSTIDNSSPYDGSGVFTTTAGLNGGNTSFGSFISLPGGNGGGGANDTTAVVQVGQGAGSGGASAGNGSSAGNSGQASTYDYNTPFFSNGSGGNGGSTTSFGGTNGGIGGGDGLSGVNGSFGSGGGGAGGSHGSISTIPKGGNGGDGYIIIRW